MKHPSYPRVLVSVVKDIKDKSRLVKAMEVGPTQGQVGVEQVMHEYHNHSHNKECILGT